MRSNALRLLAIISTLAAVASAQSDAVAGAATAAHGELPLLSFIGAGIITGGVLSLLKTRHRK